MAVAGRVAGGVRIYQGTVDDRLVWTMKSLIPSIDSVREAEGSSVHRITITIDDDLMAELDRMIEVKGYQNRSEAIRDLARAGLQQASLEEGELDWCVGVLSYTYDHTARDLAKRLTNAHHDHHDMSVASIHVHLDHQRCLEVSILKGKTDDVRHFADHMKAERRVTHGTLTVLPLKGTPSLDVK